jgi:hypothetical protein
MRAGVTLGPRAVASCYLPPSCSLELSYAAADSIGLLESGLGLGDVAGMEEARDHNLCRCNNRYVPKLFIALGGPSVWPQPTSLFIGMRVGWGDRCIPRSRPRQRAGGLATPSNPSTLDQVEARPGAMKSHEFMGLMTEEVCHVSAYPLSRCPTASRGF